MNPMFESVRLITNTVNDKNDWIREWPCCKILLEIMIWAEGNELNSQK
jgi:hypothetical protein